MYVKRYCKFDISCIEPNGHIFVPPQNVLRRFFQIHVQVLYTLQVMDSFMGCVVLILVCEPKAILISMFFAHLLLFFQHPAPSLDSK